MIFRLGIENNNDGRSIAWALEHPGCFAYGLDAADALANFPAAARTYTDWLTSRGADWLEPGDDVQAVAEESFDVTFVDRRFDLAERGRGSMVESFFRYDWKPLATTDIERLLKVLAWSRQDLMSVVQGLRPEQLRRQHTGERWDIHGILNHVGGAEWWYQERIGFPFPKREEDLPSDASARS